MYIYKSVYTYIDTHICMYYKQVGMHVCMCVCIYMYVCMYGDNMMKGTFSTSSQMTLW